MAEDPHHAPSAASSVTGRDASWTSNIPDPFLLTLGLVVVVAVVALIATEVGPAAVARAFVAGMFVPGQLAFGFQMALVLMTGTAIAAAPPVARALSRIAGLPRSGAGGAVVVGLVAMGAALLNWGLGLVVGAVLAREVGRSLRARGIPVAYGVLGAAGYVSIAVWHGGLSGSAPLKVATASAAFGAAIPVDATTFSTLNVAITAALVVAFSLALWWRGRRGDDGALVPSPAAAADLPPVGVLPLLLQLVVVVVLGGVLAAQVRERGAAAITLDWFIGASVVAGLVAHGRAGPLSWASAMGRGAGEAGGVLVHFPFYFGVVGVAVDSGLVADIAAAAAALSQALPVSVATTTALSTFVSAAIVNLVVPSGGGQWAVQGPLIVETAKALGIERAPLIMAFAYGDQLTNLLQPFWALPVLSITGLKARDLLPHTAALMAVGGVVILVGLALLT